MIASPSISEAARLALERQFEGKNRDLMVNTSSLKSRRRGGSDLAGKPSQHDESTFQTRARLNFC